MTQTVVLAGASGFIGSRLVRRFEEDGARVRTIGRGSEADARWGGDLGGVLEGADALINLAGRSVSCRYTKRTADDILRSRTETTHALGRALAQCSSPPLWINASTETIYRDARDRPQDEDTGELSSGFSVAVARAWEHELWDAPVQVRKVALRMSIVLGAGGAMNPNINLARMGFGGRQGDSGQMLSWIHIEDVYRAVQHIIADRDLRGPINLASPHAVTNEEFMCSVRRHLGGRIGSRKGVRLPAWSLEAGARIIRTEAELVLKSRWVEPRRLTQSGFAFTHPELDDALAQIAEETRRGLVPVQLG
ncbi:TIGR01777 family oxidoreductase [Brevibacterium yomogidense]|uniref:Cell division inhibitor n=1 Tax=Brevibacterium yomogidense TaxID=946573 RepID=A0A1X6XCY7_9MICO|nr:TIGR01777 family oxidoreductase [Brevibacterium yomogidense]SLM97009.1 Cell division inhibitor [Brevibacterium yomogidense]